MVAKNSSSPVARAVRAALPALLAGSLLHGGAVAHAHGHDAGAAAAIAADAAVAVPALAPDPALLAAANREQAPLMQTLKDMVLIESGSGDAAGLARMAEYTEARLKALGARTQRIPTGRGPGSIVVGTLAGRHGGGKRLMLMAHMDTVFKTGILATQPYRIEDGRVYGPGIADDKGGIAAILHALKIVQDAGWRDYAAITVLFTPDEEAGSAGSKEIIAAMAAEHDYVFSCEPTLGKREGILLGTSGFAKVTMEVRGRTAHAGVEPEQGRNALIELAHQLLQTRDVAASVPGTQMNWTIAQAGLSGNQIPEKAVATADVRLKAVEGAAQLEAALRERVRQPLVPDTQTTIVVAPGRPPYKTNAGGRALAGTAQAIYAGIGRPLELVEHTGGGTDAAYAGRSGKAVVLESLGLYGAGFHTGQEYIELQAIAPRLYLLARLMQEAARSNHVE